MAQVSSSDVSETYVRTGKGTLRSNTEVTNQVSVIFVITIDGWRDRERGISSPSSSWCFGSARGLAGSSCLSPSCFNEHEPSQHRRKEFYTRNCRPCRAICLPSGLASRGFVLRVLGDLLPLPLPENTVILSIDAE